MCIPYRPIHIIADNEFCLWQYKILASCLFSDTIKKLMFFSKCKSIEVINNPLRSKLNHREVNYINYRQQQQQQ